jgi:hypothetical protein
MLHEHFREALETLDVELARKIWAHAKPGMPQPRTDAEALMALHVARTAASSVTFRARAYSHAWLAERGLPSQLPDELKPKAERLYPRIVDAVGIAVRAISEEHKPIARMIERAMSDAVADCYANGDRDPQIVKARMREARANVSRKVLIRSIDED